MLHVSFICCVMHIQWCRATACLSCICTLASAVFQLLVSVADQLPGMQLPLVSELWYSCNRLKIDWEEAPAMSDQLAEKYSRATALAVNVMVLVFRACLLICLLLSSLLC